MINYFLKKSVVTICLNLGILLIGYFSLPQIANEFIPAIEVPAVGIVFPTTFLHHNKITNSLIVPLEKKLLATGDIEKIETTLDKDRTILFVFYKWSLKPEECLQRARQVVSSIKKPEGVLDPILVLHRPTMSPIFKVAFYGAKASVLTKKLQSFAETVERLPGVAQVNLVGASPTKGQILLDPLAASSKGLSALDLLKTSKETWSFRHFFNANDSSVAQYLKIKLDDINDFKKLSINSSTQKQQVPLKWIAKIQETNDPASVIFGAQDEALILEVIKSPGSDAISIVENVKEAILNIKQQTPYLESTIVYNEAEKIKQAQAGVIKNFTTGVILNSIILIIFLGSIIGAVVASCVFPTAIFGTLFIMKSMDISLNIFALNGFSLASGMITDSSIVVLEAIMRRFQKGEELLSSCSRGTKDVMLGVFASTLTTAAVVIPISMQSGVSSKLFSDLGVVLVATQFVCLIAVFTFVPWLCSKILTNDDHRPAPIEYLFNWSSLLVRSVSQFSSSILERTVKQIKFRVGIPVILTVVSLITLAFIPNSEFLPVVSSKIYSISIPIKRIELIERGSIWQKKIAAALGEQTKIDWLVTTKTDDTINSIFALKNANDIQEIIQNVSKSLNIPINKIISNPIGPTPPTEPMSYSGYYYLQDNLPQKTKNEFIDRFCASDGIYDCTTSSHYREPTMLLKPEPLNMARGNTNILEATMNIASLTKNFNMTSLTNLPLSTDVELKINTSDLLSNAPVLTGKARKTLTQLGNLFSSSFNTSSNVHFRRNGRNFEPFYFRIKDITLGQAVSHIHEIQLELGISDDALIPMGTIETMNDTFGKMIGALVLSAFLILLVLVVQFKSFVQALIIMYSIPLSLGGAILGLIIMDETLNVGVIVGFILLIGIIVNNGILLMDAINQRLVSGMSLLESIKESVDSRTRPILMTTFSTVFGMLPTLILKAEGKELYQGMAIVNIFGMIFGTGLTLIVTPILVRTALSWQNRRTQSPIKGQ